MRSSKIFLAPTIFIVIPAALWSTLSLAESAADECRAKPGAAAPVGSHWYYRINRPDGRHCWYLGQGGIKVRSAASEETHAPAHSLKRQRARSEAAVSAPPQAAPSQATPAPAATASLAPAPPLSGDNSSVTDFAVRWRELPPAFGINARGPATRMSDATGPGMTERPEAAQPALAAAVKRAELQQPPSEAAFIPTMLTGTLAITLLLSAAIVKLARRLNKHNAWRTAPAWLDAYRQLRADPAAGSRAPPVPAPVPPAPAQQPGGLRWRSAKRTEAANLKANLQQLLCDLRRAEAESEPPRKFEPDGRRQLRLMLSKFAASRSRLEALNGEEGLGSAGRQSDLPSPIAQPMLRRRSAA